ncbi:putative sterigmatocystin biosynthesis polyketide synthase [Tolypocladium ophioglossoides CBS 100239]|uniref:Putative sterigmatocystin biosynthesis polyketide synthase n=1 Tax=Tolypocladium ophioglossoides (strain CBS 100239) TaxID=1163406 RepID=A0A0L0N516_TOLOC|nr:putative sterigmatocystin biosynthesis polyketide synthase [Tolypocladium ophioglossoides CBS 100239]
MAYGDILVFAGQGSDSHFSDRENLVKLRHRLDGAREHFNAFLRGCRDAFHEAFESLHAEEKAVFEQDTAEHFRDPENLILPGPRFQSHPVFETTTLYVRQILELILYLQRHDKTSEPLEVTGVCTGILPAIIAAASPSYLSKPFINNAVDGFRVAFWIGLRVSIWCRTALADRWTCQPCLVTVFRLSPHVIAGFLESHNEQYAQEAMKIRISAILDDEAVSVSGPGESLGLFQSTLQSVAPEASCRWGHVHGYYHGSDQMKRVVEEVLTDVQRCRIEFPSWNSLHCLVRSATSGKYFHSDDEAHPLLQSALRGILVEPVNWKLTQHTITQTYTQRASAEPGNRFRLLGLGPSSKALLHKINTAMLSQGLQVIRQFSEDIASTDCDSIAVIGISANFPSGKGTEEFWSTIVTGKSTATEIPSSRFRVSDYYKADNQRSPKARKMGSKQGNFLQNPFEFDAEFFHISPREAKSMDPQQRLLLHGAVEALEDAGYSPNATSSFNRESFGVYVGVATGDYVDNLRDDIDVYYSPGRRKRSYPISKGSLTSPIGTLRAFLSGRISYCFGFKGPSMVIDTACSSSTVALYHACKALQSGDCTAALAGGVNVISSPNMYLGLSRAHFLSPTGQCKPFDASADGYCRGEGCGLVVLKKLSNAIEDGDHIYGIARGVGVNQCGTAKSITHPDHETQAALFSQVLGACRTSPDSIDVVEAHGTGTQAGDFAEVSSLSAVFKDRNDQHPLHLCSVKGNIGHTEAASGAAGLIKLLLMMERSTIPPLASFTTLNPRLTMMRNHGMVIPTSAQAWTGSDSRPRRALLNNFGAAGSNAALILEEAPRSRHREYRLNRPRSCHLLNLSAKSAPALHRLKSKYINFIRDNPSIRIDDLCYSANARRVHHAAHRWSGGGTSLDELLKMLQSDDDSRESVSLVTTKTVFIFSGQGGVYEGMGAELLSTAPEFRSSVERCDAILASHGFPTTMTFFDPVHNDEVLRTEREQIIVAQCACFVLEYSLARLWMKFGITPDLVLGHSIGEFAALTTAKILSIEGALLFVARRAELMFANLESQMSTMLACRASPQDMSSLLQHLFPDQARGVSIACYNSPEDCVVAGPVAMLTQVAESCRSEGVRCKTLNVPYGFHSHAMDPILPQLKDLATSLAIRAPTIQLGSSVYGRLLTEYESIPSEYLVMQTRQPVRFAGALEAIKAKHSRSRFCMLEIGPSPSTISMTKSALGESLHKFLPTLRSSEAPWITISTSLQSLYKNKFTIQWSEVHRGESSRFMRDIPRYPLAGAHFVTPFSEHAAAAHTRGKHDTPGELEQPFQFLGPHSKTTTSNELVSFQVGIERLSQFIKSHVVGGIPLCPASIYLELVLEAISIQRVAHSYPLSIEAVSFFHPLVYAHGNREPGSVRLELWAQSGDVPRYSAQFTVSNQESEQKYCSGRVSTATSKSIADGFLRKTAYVKRQRLTSLQRPRAHSLETFTSRTIYDVIFHRVVAYTEPLRTLKFLTVNSLGLEGYGLFTLSALSDGKFVCHPAFMDTILHAAGFIANMKVELDTACICVSIDHFVLPDLSGISLRGELGIYCSIIDVGTAVVAEAYVVDDQEQVIAYADGMCFKKVRLSTFKSILARAAEAGRPAQRQSRATKLQTRAPRTPSTEDEQSPTQKPSGAQTTAVATVQGLLRDVCGVSCSEFSRPLVELGVDSLLFIELTQSVAAKFPHLCIPKKELTDCQTAQGLVQVISLFMKKQSPKPQVQGPDIDLVDSSSANSLSPDSATTFSEESIVPSVTSISSQLDALLLDLCGRSFTTTDGDTTIGSMGIDSLMSIELVHDLRTRFDIDIGTEQSSLPDMTLRQIEALCAQKITGSSDSGIKASRCNGVVLGPQKPHIDDPILSQLIPADFPDLLQDHGIRCSAAPLYLFHDGSGLSTMYSKLGQLGRNVYGMFSQDVPSINPAVGSMEDMAALYIDRAKLMSTRSPILCGWSFGGVLALEVSRQLIRRGQSPKGIILIDSPVPVEHEPLPEAIISSIVENLQQRPKNAQSKHAQHARTCIEAQFRRQAGLLSRYNPPAAVGSVPCIMINCNRTIDTKTLYGVSYPWLSDDRVRNEASKAWERLLGRTIPVLEVNCNHFEVFDAPMVAEVSEKLEEACSLLDGGE